MLAMHEHNIYRNLLQGDLIQQTVITYKADSSVNFADAFVSAQLGPQGLAQVTFVDCPNEPTLVIVLR